jgi:hypothetical protein
MRVITDSNNKFVDRIAEFDCKNNTAATDLCNIFHLVNKKN